MLADMTDYYLNTMETLQCSRTTKRGSEANNKRHQKSAKKRGVVRILPNKREIPNNKKILNEHKLEPNTTACKYLNNSRHGNLPGRK